MNKTTLLLIIGFVFFWNSGFIGAEYGVPYAGPYTLLFWRYLGLTAVMFTYLLVRKKLRWVGWQTAFPNMIIGVLAHGLWLACALLALERNVPAGIVALVVSLQPLSTGAFSGLVTGERISLFQWLGLSLGFTGVALTVAFRIDFENTASIFGYLIPLGSVAGITTASLIQRKMVITNNTRRLPVDLSLFYQSLATTVVAAIPAIFSEQLATQWTSEFVYSMIWLILAVSLGAYALMWRLIERINATRVASLFYLGPPVTMFMAWLAFGDQIKTMDVVGLTVVLLGVMITQRKSRYS